MRHRRDVIAAARKRIASWTAPEPAPWHAEGLTLRQRQDLLDEHLGWPKRSVSPDETRDERELREAREWASQPRTDLVADTWRDRT